MSVVCDSLAFMATLRIQGASGVQMARMASPPHESKKSEDG
jgi:hypothetical protein